MRSFSLGSRRFLRVRASASACLPLSSVSPFFRSQRRAAVRAAAVDLREHGAGPRRSTPPSASISCGKFSKLTSTTWLTSIPSHSLTVCVASAGPPNAYAALILFVPLPGDVDHGVARDRERRVRAAADPQQHDRVRAARAAAARLREALGARVGAEHEDRVRAGQRERAGVELVADLVREVAALDLRGDHEQDGGDRDPREQRDREPLDDAPGGDPAARRAGRARRAPGQGRAGAGRGGRSCGPRSRAAPGAGRPGARSSARPSPSGARRGSRRGRLR